MVGNAHPALSTRTTVLLNRCLKPPFLRYLKIKLFSHPPNLLTRAYQKWSRWRRIYCSFFERYPAKLIIGKLIEHVF